LAEKVKVTSGLSVWNSGPMSGTTESIVVSGGGVTLQLWLAGLRSTLPAASLARTRSWCTPTASPVYSGGDGQVPKVPPSREHSKVEPVSLDENVKVASVLPVSAGGPESIVVCGAVVSGGGSIVQE
jgi:hypothetical protein